MTQVLAVFTELERRLIRERTKAALAVKRVQGMKLGRPRTLPAEVIERIHSGHAAGASWSAITRELNTAAVPTAQGGPRWYPATAHLIATRDPARAT